MSRELVNRVNEHEEGPIKVIEFILKLAQDPATLDPSVRKKHVSAIVRQLESVELDDFFPEVLQIVNPLRFYTQTKQLDDYAKAILSEAVDNYCGR